MDYNNESKNRTKLRANVILTLQPMRPKAQSIASEGYVPRVRTQKLRPLLLPQ